jgi:succinate dehydrogenase / fumarate reductase flavoprotein subunit
MQGLADGYFVIPYTIGDYFGATDLTDVTSDTSEFQEVSQENRDRLEKLLSLKGEKSPRQFHRELGEVLWDDVGMGRNAEGLKRAIGEISRIRQEYWENLRVPGRGDTLNKYLEFASRVADYLELGELMARDALLREESCGGHFREEYQTEEGEALRNDEEFSFAAAWEFTGVGQEPALHKEELSFENVELATRSYK